MRTTFPSQMKPLRSEEENECFLLLVFLPPLYTYLKVSRKNSWTGLDLTSLQARSRSRRSPEAHGGAALLRGAAP